MPAEQRLAAVAVLRDREPALSPLQRMAVIDAAARWMDEDTGDELAYALLSAACSSDVATSQAYVELLTPASNRGTNGETNRVPGRVVIAMPDFTADALAHVLNHLGQLADTLHIERVGVGEAELAAALFDAAQAAGYHCPSGTVTSEAI